MKSTKSEWTIEPVKGSMIHFVRHCAKGTSLANAKIHAKKFAKGYGFDMMLFENGRPHSVVKVS